MFKLLKNRYCDRVLSDLMKRALPGIPIYFGLWCVIIFSTGYHQTDPKFSYTYLAIFIFSGLFRTLHQSLFRRLSVYSPAVNYTLLLIGVMIPAVFWSAAFVKIMLGSDYTIKVLMVMGSAGIAVGGINSFAPDRPLAFSFMIILTCPTAFAILLFNPSDIAISLLIFMYIIFTLVISSKSHREYWVALENENELEKKSGELERINKIDALTSVYNRRHFNEIFDIEWKRGSREKASLSLILIDIDHFKAINDTYGHLAGDDYLKETARFIRSSFKRSTDVVARYGGEEFVVLLPGTDLNNTVRLAEKVRQGIDDLFVFHEGNSLHTTISLGIASCVPNYKDSNESLLTAADRALYRSKESGRNQTTTGKIIPVESGDSHEPNDSDEQQPA